MAEINREKLHQLISERKISFNEARELGLREWFVVVNNTVYIFGEEISKADAKVLALALLSALV